MKPSIEILSREQVHRVLDDARLLLTKVGTRVQSVEARALLYTVGAEVNKDNDIVHIPDKVVDAALKRTPSTFYLHDRLGKPTIQYGGNNVHFDPGSSGVHILDPDTLEHRPSRTSDLVRVVKVAEMLSQYDAQSTALVCNEVPKTISDLYRLYVVLMLSQKPIVTGSFSIKTLDVMIEMLALFSGGRKELAEKPQAVFDVCPTPPLIWSEFGAQNLLDLARAGVPAEMVSMPLAGVAAPVTLLGSITQHAAESLAGITIHQAANAGAPIVWGGAPAIFDMRKGGTPFGAIETAMINAACAQVGQALNLPTHGYLGASDSKVIDAQSGMESISTVMVGALAGINMISGAGMLDFLACQSPEKLVLDSEAITSTKRLINGISDFQENILTTFYDGFDFKSDFLKKRITRDLFMSEQSLPTDVIDRDSLRGWQAGGSLDAFQRARERTKQLLKDYRRPELDKKQETELNKLVSALAIKADLIQLPALD
ncbi:MAG: trimethylamine methyltransferase family protein [Anaerolineaceae bacterium]